MHFINVKLEQQTCNTCGLNTARTLMCYNQKQQSVSDTHKITCIRTHTHTSHTASLFLSQVNTNAGMGNKGRLVQLAGISRRADQIYIRL